MAVKKRKAAQARSGSSRSSQQKTKGELREFPVRQGSTDTELTSRELGRIEEPKTPFPEQHQPRPGIESKIEPRPRYHAPHYRGSGKLENKIALITGGDSGIGRAIAVLYAREGADVAIVYLPEEQNDAEETSHAVENEGRQCLLIPGDVKDAEFCREAVEQTVQEYGKLDILVNNAAYQEHQPSIDEVSEEQFERTFRTNIFGYFYMAKNAVRHMKRGSAIVNCSSETGLMGSKQLLDYSATKGAINAFTKSLAQQMVERGIRVNAVAPGPVWTPLNVADKEAKEVATHGSKVPMERPAQPEEVAPAFVFFASEVDSSYITGEVMSVLGGQTTA